MNPKYVFALFGIAVAGVVIATMASVRRYSKKMPHNRRHEEEPEETILPE